MISAITLLVAGCFSAGNWTATSECEQQIKLRLKDPDSASFRDELYYAWKHSDRPAKVTVKVRAQNSFGAFLTRNWRCDFSDEGRFVGAYVDE